MESRRAQYLADRFGGKFVQLSESMIEKTLKVNQLVDMEWRFGGLLFCWFLFMLSICIESSLLCFVSLILSSRLSLALSET